VWYVDILEFDVCVVICFTASSQNNSNLDEAVGEVKPLVIVSCWSKAATHETDCGSSQHEQASTR
jgi:hypothetical protein